MGSMKDLFGDTPYPGPARVARDEAISRVTKNSGTFIADAEAAFGRLFTRGERLIGEEIRLRFEAHGIRPHHHNAWGGLINGFLRRGRLQKNGTYRGMATTRSHARATAEMEVL